MAEQLLLRTPRTDAYVEFWLKDRIALWPDFARQLERELNAQIHRTHQGPDRQDDGNQVMPDPPKPRPHIYPGRKIDPAITKAILNDKTKANYRELAKRHDVSVYYVWSVKNKQRTK